jgi:PmbA protein
MTAVDLAQILDLAKRAGADAADVLLIERRSVSVGWRLGELEELERKEETDLGLRVFVGRRQAVAATSRTDRTTIEPLMAELVLSARHLPEDPWAGLSDPDELARDVPDLDLEDGHEPTVEDLMQAAAACEDAARAVPGITNSEGAGAAWSSARVSLAASNGFSGSYRRTAHRLGVVVLAGSGTAMERDYEYRSATHRADLPTPEEIGRKAAERTIRRLGPQKAGTAEVPVVFDPRVASSLAGHLVAAISGEAIARGTSFLKDRLGQQVLADGITILDDPHRRRGLASRPFDVEGVATLRRALVDRGRLTTWLLDQSSARRLGLRSTGHAARGTSSVPAPAASNLTIEPGTMTPAELMADIREGFYVTETMGMGVNLVTGDYSRGAAGFRIANGEIAHPVSEVTIAGNLGDMFRRMTAADDLVIKGSNDAPTVRIDGMTVAGK